MPEADVFERFEFAPEDCFRPAGLPDIFPERPDAPVELDLGCGDGSFLLALARSCPDDNFLGVERLLGRVRRVCRAAERGGLRNVRVLRLETGYTVAWLLPQGRFRRIHLLFPDPWPKKKHWERRLVTPRFAAAARDLLEAGGEFLFKSDHEDYFAEAAAVLRETPGWEEMAWEDGAFPYPETDFERRWKREGKPIRRLRLRRTC